MQRTKKQWGNVERKKKVKKYRFKVNKLFLYVFLNSFHLFSFIIGRLNNLKYIYKFLINFYYIFIYILHNKPNIKK